jgi:RND superfamily putative drug exporter
MSPLKHSNNFAARMGRWSAGHWKTAVFGWLAFVVASFAIGMTVGTNFLKTSDANVGEAAKADKIIKEGFDVKVDEMGEVVFVQNKKLDVHDPAFKAAIGDITRTLDRFPQVRKIQSPLAPSHANQISKDGHAVMITFTPKGDFAAASLYIDNITKAVDKVESRHHGFYVEEIGSVSTEKKFNAILNGQLVKVGMIALLLTLVILLFVFGSAVAALVPLLLSLTAVMATIQLVSIPSQFIPVDEQIAEVILLIGLAVGIDYSLFYIRREREERRAGRGERAALEAAAATSGRAVLVSGFTVLIAMAGMFFSGDKTFMSFSVGTMLVVFVAMIGSLTVLPALLGRLGDKIEKGRIPFLHRLRSKDGEGRFWKAVLTRVLRRPVLSAVLSGGVLVALAIPAFTLNPAQTSTKDIDIPEVQPLIKFEKSFPGGNDPARVAVKADNVNAPAVQKAIANLKRAALASGQMNDPIEVDTNKAGTVATVDIPLAGNGSDKTSKAALHTLRAGLLPKTLGEVDGVEYAVTGFTAADEDWKDSMMSSAPIVFGFVLIFAFLLLTAAFRSVVVAGKAVILNLLSVAAAYGILVIIFQHGFGESLLGFHSNGGITPWLPMFLFVILFGLSMDYHVFILSRVREAYGRGLSNEQAVSLGIRQTAGVVTSAATVMVVTFAVFALIPIIDFKEMGIGLAAAVLIDATLIRAVLLPATMKLLGDRNWYLPRWLEWLPSLEHDETPKAPPGPVAVAVPARAR